MTIHDVHRDLDAPTATPVQTPRLILGTVVSNGGDAAILHAQLNLLQRGLGAATTIIEDNDPVLARQMFPALEVVEPGRLADIATRTAERLGHVERPGLRRVTGRLARRDLPAVSRRAADARLDRTFARGPHVFYTGGTSLIEKYDLRQKLGHIQRAIDLGRDVVLLPQSVGPFRDAGNIAAVRAIVASATLVLLRDERSLRHLREIGADLDRVRVVPDVVFCLAEQDDVDRLGRAEIPAHGARVAVGIRDCRKFFAAGDPDVEQERLERRYADMVTHLVRERGAQVRFVSTCQGIERYWTDDSEVSMSVYERLPADVRESCVVDRGFHDTEDLRRVLAGQDLVVANRLHGAILTLTVGVPVVPVEYEFKTREVFRQLHQEHAVYSIDETGSRSLAEHVDGFVAAWDANRAGAMSSLQTVVRESWATADLIEKALHRRA